MQFSVFARTCSSSVFDQMRIIFWLEFKSYEFDTFCFHVHSFVVSSNCFENSIQYWVECIQIHAVMQYVCVLCMCFILLFNRIQNVRILAIEQHENCLLRYFSLSPVWSKSFHYFILLSNWPDHTDCEGYKIEMYWISIWNRLFVSMIIWTLVKNVHVQFSTFVHYHLIIIGEFALIFFQPKKSPSINRTRLFFPFGNFN